jgi:hypothetical protein
LKRPTILQTLLTGDHPSLYDPPKNHITNI